jgi:hypothetical protein
MLVSYAKSISEMAKKGAEVAKKKGRSKQCGKMCADCAFKWEQDHTLGYFIAADNAAYALMSEGGFHCHTHDHKDAGRTCVGFLLAKLVFEK